MKLRPNIICKLFCTTVILLFSCQIFGQLAGKTANEYRFSNLNVSNGLSQSTVLSIFQDKFGFIWLGTRNGLNLYDGSKFIIFRNHFGNQNGLSGNIINDITEDKRDIIWIASNQGLSSYDRKNQLFKNYAIPNDAKVEIFDLEIDGDLLYAGTSKGLYVFDTIKDRFEPAQQIFRSLEGIANQYITSLYIKANELYIGTNNNGAYIFHLRQLTNRHITHDDLAKYGNGSLRVDAILKDSKGNVWIGTYGNGLYRINQDGQILHYSEFNVDSPYRISNNNVRSIELDPSGNLWVGTFNGLNILNAKNASIKQIKHQENDPSGISHSSIRSIFRDRKGSMWVGTYYGGANIFDRDEQQFQHYISLPGRAASLNNNVVSSFTTDASGNLIIGTEGGGINVFDPRSKIFKTARTEMPIDNRLIVKALFRAKDNSVWVGTFKNGLQLFSSAQLSVTPCPQDRSGEFSGLEKSIVNVIIEDKSDHLWIGTDGLGGLNKFDTKTRSFVNFPYRKAVQRLLNKASVKHLLFDRDNRLWIATRDMGLFSFNVISGKITQYRGLRKPGLLDEVNTLAIDHAGIVWVGTNGKGIVAINEKDKTLRHLHAGNGLGNNVIYNIIEDANTDLWFTNPTGLTKLERKANRFINYTHLSGFPLLEVNDGAFFKADRNLFLIGGNNGFVLFDPLKIRFNNYVPPLLITQLDIPGQFGRKVNLVSSDEQRGKQVINLNYKESVFSISFTTLNYTGTKNMRYAYQMEGLEEDWYPIGEQKNVTFTSLPSGNYVFKIKSSPDGTNWNPVADQLEIHVIPPPWLSWWAMVIYFLLIILAIWLLRDNAVRRTQLSHNLKLEQVEKERWKEIHDLKLKYFTDVSHEFRTPLTLIVNPLEELMDGESSPWAKKRLKLIYYNAKRLLLLIDQVLDVNRLDTGHAQLNVQPLAINHIIAQIVDTFKLLADKRSIKLIYDQPMADEHLYLVDHDKLEKIFYNVLSNAFKFTPNGGTISLIHHSKFFKDHTTFSFRIADTGIGIDQQHLDRIFDRFYKVASEDSGVGIGLALTKSLVELMKGKIIAHGKPNEGTTISITIPFTRAQANDTEKPAKVFVKSLPLEYQETYQQQNNFEDDEFDSKEIILVAEDNKEISNYLVEQLKKSKYRVLSARDGKKALDQILKVIPDLVITDVMMPEMDGLTLCRNIKDNPLTSHIPVIMLTAKTDELSRLEGLDHGADDYLSKPFIIKELQVRIKNMLQNRKLVQKHYKNGKLLQNGSASINKFDQQLFNKIVSIIETHIAEPTLTVDFISDKIGLSRVHLFRKVKALTGMAPSEFIKDLRLIKAEQYLKDEQLKVAELSYKVGFQDIQYFSKCFKRKYKLSPQRYLQEIINIGDTREV